mgnify:CR=1 FL=1
MATIKGNKQQLIASHYEIQQFQQQMPTIATMLGGRIESFYKQNSAKLNAAIERRGKIYEKYVKREGDTYLHDKDNKPVLIEPTLELNDEDKAKWYADKQLEFEKELADFFAEGVEWII